MKDFLKDYISQQKNTLDTIPLEKVSEIVSIFREALRKDQQIFVFGNGGSAANASHFVTDLGKGSSDKTSRRFRCMSINDNYGAGVKSGQVFYVTLGSGVGAGLVINKKIYHGAKNSEAEFGHIRLDKGGRTVESSCSGWAVDQKIRKYVELNPDSVLSQLTKDLSRGEARVLKPALDRQDQATIRIVEETTDDLAFALSHVVHLLNPETIILGGGLSLIGEPLRQRVEQKLPGYVMDVLRPGPSIQLSTLKEDAVPVGALALAIHKIESA